MGSKVSKNADGYGYKYTDIAEIHNWLEEQGYQYQQYVEVIDGNDYIVTIPILNGEKQAPMRGCRVVSAQLNGKSNPAQEHGAAITYARRYSLLMAFGLATTDDDVQCQTTYEKSEKGKNVTELENSKVNSTKVTSLKSKCFENNVDEAFICKKMNVSTLEDLTEKQFLWICHNWTKEFVNGGKGKD